MKGAIEMTPIQLTEQMSTKGIVDINLFFSVFGLNFKGIEFESDQEVIELANHLLRKHSFEFRVDFDGGCTSFVKYY